MSDLTERVEDRLADFTRDKRVIVLSWMALIHWCAQRRRRLCARLVNCGHYQSRLLPAFFIGVSISGSSSSRLSCHHRSGDRRSHYRFHGSLRVGKNPRPRYS